MRADRLVATLLILQRRGRLTALELAEELETSERTARRDLMALSAAGIPVYSQRGRGGGWSLVGGARTDLTGLNAGEIRALFLVAGPSAAATPELRTALRKLVRALPATLRSGAEAASRALVIDGTDWRRTTSATAPPHFDAVQQAVVEGTQIVLGYAGPRKPVGLRTVHPLGLVSKAGIWYLVAGTDDGLRTFRLSRVTSVEATGEPVSRPDGFDLAAVWHGLATQVEERMLKATVQARADERALPILRELFGGRLRIGDALAEGEVAIEVAGPTPEILAAQLAGLGPRVEILSPASAREWTAGLAAELARMYWPSATFGEAAVPPAPAADDGGVS